MQYQLKSSGDGKVPALSRPLHGYRRSTATASKKSGGHGTGNHFLATDVTTLDMSAMFLSKKTKKSGHGAPGAANLLTSNAFLGSQTASNGFTFSPYFNHASLYSNMDLMHAAASGDVPSLMSVPATKPASLLHGANEAPAMDFAQFTEELNAIQGMSYAPVTYPMSLQSFFPDNDYSSFPSYISSTRSNSFSSSGRLTGGRKNRMVEVKSINGQLFIETSDPQAASVSARTDMIRLSGSLMDFARKCLDSRNIEPVSSEPLYSRKVFIGGLPIDVTDAEVWATFGAFGKVLIDWPRRPEHGNGRGDHYDPEMGRRSSRSVSGYVFLVFTHERSVQDLVNACEFHEDKYYLQLSSPTMTDKAVQVRPWRLSDIDYFCYENSFVDHRRTVFIGGVPRPTRASDLAGCLEKLYGKVSYVGIDIDPELKYPKGAARATFATSKSFVSAITGRFVEVHHTEQSKRVEIKPYVMEEQHCDECEGKLCKHAYAQYYCGDPSCLQYYCEVCWDRMHYEIPGNEKRPEHKPMVRRDDQTKVLEVPSHHNQYQTYTQNRSIISKVFGRNSSMMESHPPKPFSAVPTSIGY